MGQPIFLAREEEKMTVYGPNQAQVHIAQGWRPVEESVAQSFESVDDLTAIKGVGEATAAILADAGFRSYVAIAEAPTEKLAALDKISPNQAQNIQVNVAELL